MNDYTKYSLETRLFGLMIAIGDEDPRKRCHIVDCEDGTNCLQFDCIPSMSMRLMDGTNKHMKQIILIKGNSVHHLIIRKTLSSDDLMKTVNKIWKLANFE